MIISTNQLSSLPNLIECRLSQSAEDASSLSLAFEGFLPLVGEKAGAWLEYLAPVTLLRDGVPYFHGKVTGYSFSNEAGDKKTKITATDFIWLLDKSNLGAQINSLQIGDASLAMVGSSALRSWEQLAQNLRLRAPGWACDSGGAPLEDAILSADISRAGTAMAGELTEDCYITAWEGLLKMKSANPNSLSLARPDGKLELISIAEAQEMTLQSESLLSVSELAPRNEDLLDGVAVVINYEMDGDAPFYPGGPLLGSEEEQQVPGHWEKGGYVITDPPDLDLAACNVKIFSASVPYKYQVTTQAAHMWEQVQAYYSGRSVLQWGGSVSLLASALDSSPIAKRLSITGSEAHPDWEGMKAIVTAVDWDFCSGEVTLTLGKSISDPEVNSIAYEVQDEPEPEESEETTTTTEGTEPPLPGSFFPGGCTQGSEGEWPSSSSTSSSTSSTSDSSESFSLDLGGCNCDYKWDQLLKHYNNDMRKAVNSLLEKVSSLTDRYAYLDSTLHIFMEAIAYYLCNFQMPELPDPPQPKTPQVIDPLVFEEPDADEAPQK